MKRRARVAQGLVAAWALAGCGPTPSTAGEQVPAPEKPVCGPDAPRYLAFLASGRCRDVPSSRSDGTWVASSLFPEAPEGLRDSACAYQWTASPSAPSAADVEALSALQPEHLTRGLDAPATCNAPVLAQGYAKLNPPPEPGAAGAPIGVVGCDVCARVYGRTLFAILPPDRLDLRTVLITTTGGQLVSFDVWSWRARKRSTWCCRRMGRTATRRTRAALSCSVVGTLASLARVAASAERTEMKTPLHRGLLVAMKRVALVIATVFLRGVCARPNDWWLRPRQSASSSRHARQCSLARFPASCRPTARFGCGLAHRLTP